VRPYIIQAVHDWRVVERLIGQWAARLAMALEPRSAQRPRVWAGGRSGAAL